MIDESTQVMISQYDWNVLQGEVKRLNQRIQILEKEIGDLKATKKKSQTGPKYRVVEFAPEQGRRHAKKIRETLLITCDRAEVKKFISDYWDPSKPRKPYAELSMYLGQRRIYAYEL